MKTIIISLLLISTTAFGQYPSGESVLRKIDKNMSSTNRVTTSRMIINHKRGARTVESKSWAVGVKKSFTEYLAPAREKGTKMLKLEDELWVFSPSADRTIKISGHMLRQSVMGSDLSYEDMMEDRKLYDDYNAVITAEEEIDGRKCWLIELTAKTSDVAYHMQKMWVDTERYIPLKSEQYAKGGKLLKKMIMGDVKNIDGRWYPMKITFRDMLKNSGGTEFIVDEIKFNVTMPDHIFTKASLR